MEIEEVPFTMEGLDAHSTFFSDQVRGKGLHVGQVIRDLANRVIYKGKRTAVEDMVEGGAEITTLNTYAEVGWCWEQVLTSSFRVRMLQRRQKETHDYLISGVEFEEDGIFMNPDGAEVTGDCPPVVEEYKATWRSSSKMDNFPYHFFEWDHQIAAYCRKYETLHARLFVLWVCGNYRPFPKPNAVLYHLHYTRDELEQRWHVVTQHAALMREEGRG